MQLGDLQKALEDFDLSLNITTDQPQVYIHRGQCQLELNQPDLALADFDRAVKLAPESASALAGRAGAYFTIGEQEKGMADLDQAIRLDDHTASYFYLRGKQRLLAGSWQAAIADFNQTLRLDWDNLDAHLLRGQAFSQAGEYEKAALSFGSLIGLDPENPAAYAARAQVFIAQEDYSAAIADMNEAIRLDSSEPQYYTLRGQAYCMSGNPLRCLGDIRSANKLGPETPLSLFNLGLALAHSGELEVALKTLDRAVEMEPGFDVYHARADVQFALQAYEEALADYQAAARYEPAQSALLFEQAAAMYLAGDLQAAADQAHQALMASTDAGWQAELEPWVDLIDEELQGNAAIDLAQVALTEANYPDVTGDCETEEEIVVIHNQLRGGTEEYDSSYCVKFSGVYMLVHITRMPTRYQQFIFDEDLREKEDDLDDDEKFVWLEGMQPVGDTFYGDRDLASEGGEDFVTSDIIFRRGFVGQHIQLMYWDELDDELTALSALAAIDEKIIQVLLETLPFPTGLEGLKSIPFRLD